MPTKSDNLSFQNALSHIKKKFGHGAVMQLDEQTHAAIPSSPTGSLGVDLAIGVGGLPQGRIIEFFGPPSSAKSTLALHAMAETQKRGAATLLIDSEHAFDKAYATRLGISPEQLFIAQPDHAEQALEIADQLIRSGGVGLVVIDSVAALVPKSELNGEMGDHSIGAQARLMSQALRKITGAAHRTQTTCIFINQIREKVGVFFGSPETTPGGRALRFYASVRLDLRRGAWIKDPEGQVVGHSVVVKVVKNKVAPPFKMASFDLIYGQGICRYGEIIDISLSLGLVKRTGSWLSYEAHKLGQGRAAAKGYLAAQPAVREELMQRIKESMPIPVRA